MTLTERREFAQWFMKDSDEFKRYNDVEKVILFFKFHYGWGRPRIAKKLGIGQRAVGKFLSGIKEPERAYVEYFRRTSE